MNLEAGHCWQDGVPDLKETRNSSSILERTSLAFLSTPCCGIVLFMLLSDCFGKSDFIHLTEASCLYRNKAGWLDSELNMFTHQYLQQSRQCGKRRKTTLFPFSAPSVTAENMVGDGIPKGNEQKAPAGFQLLCEQQDSATLFCCPTSKHQLLQLFFSCLGEQATLEGMCALYIYRGLLKSKLKYNNSEF